ncbi:MAG TPA: hypothetical protein VH063_13405 [Gaiellaceae bacterium]|nr:hypothetical protein [Gaiellaceae bacterium]
MGGRSNGDLGPPLCFDVVAGHSLMHLQDETEGLSDTVRREISRSAATDAVNQSRDPTPQTNSQAV